MKKIIDAVQSPLGFFTLIVLVFEGSLIVLLPKAPHSIQGPVIFAMVISIVFMVLVVAYITLKNPGIFSKATRDNVEKSFGHLTGKYKSTWIQKGKEYYGKASIEIGDDAIKVLMNDIEASSYKALLYPVVDNLLAGEWENFSHDEQGVWAPKIIKGGAIIKGEYVVSGGEISGIWELKRIA